MPKDYIDREALLKEIDDCYDRAHIQSITREEPARTLWNGICTGINRCRNEIIEAPAADVTEVVHGRWLQTTELLGWQDVDCVECSVCHEDWVLESDFDIEDYKARWHYCPSCGAKMDEESEGEGE